MNHRQCADGNNRKNGEIDLNHREHSDDATCEDCLCASEDVAACEAQGESERDEASRMSGLIF